MSLILDGTTGCPVTTVTGTLPVANGGTGVATSTGTGAVVLGTSPTLTTPTFNSAQLATVSGTAPLYMCRAWGVFTGTTGVMLASGNASVSRTSAGIYPVTFTTAMPDANYSVSIGFTGTSATGTAANRNCLLMFRDLATSGFNIVSTDPTSGAASDTGKCAFQVIR